MKQPNKKNIGLFRIILISLIAVCVMVSIYLAVSSGGRARIKSLFGSFKGMDPAEEFYYNVSFDGSFANVGDGGLAALSSTEIWVSDKYGEETISKLIAFSSPALCASGSYGAAYDIGGKSVIFFSTSSIISEITSEERIISASVNSKGYLAVCTEESGYGGCVTVYNSKGTAIYRWHSGSSYVISADIRGGSELLVNSIGESGGTLTLLSLSDESEKAVFSCGELIIEAAFTESGVTAVTSSRLISLTGSLEESAVYDYSGRHLNFYAIGSDYSVLVLSDYQVAGTRMIISLDKKCSELGSAISGQDILSLDICGKYISVLHPDSAMIYKSDISLHNSFNDISGVAKLLTIDNGDAIAVGAYSARLLS